MAGFTEAVRDDILTDRLVTPSTYFALFVGDPEGAGTEVSGNGYARQLITFGTPASGGGSVRQTDNTNAPTDTASGGSWGTVDYGAIYDASTAGNRIHSGPLTASKTIADGDSYTLAIGAYVATLEPAP